MTDLSTTNLQRLLDEATPGPWTALDRYSDGASRPDTSYQMRDAAGDYLGIMHGQDAALAALSPQLAVEVLWMRLEIGELRDTLARTATECAILDNHEGRLAARIAQSAAETLFRIMQGDPDD